MNKQTYKCKSVTLRIVDAVILFIILLFIGFCVWQTVDYMTNRILYDTYSAPWYTGIIAYGGIAAISLIVLFVLRWLVISSDKKREKETDNGRDS